MKKCTIGATPLELLLNRPMGLLALRGHDGDDDGAKPDGTGEEDEDGAKPDESKNEEKSGKEGKDGGAGKGETVESLTRKLTNAEEARNRAVDKRDELIEENKQLNAKIAQMEKDGSPDETIKAENEQLKAGNATLQTTNERLMLEIALRDDKAHEWTDPTAVLKLVDLSEVDFDAKTNKPRGLKAALDKLAKDSPYLLKPKSTDDEEENKGGARQTGRTPAPGRKSSANGQAREAALRAKYPGLRR